ncbi:Hydroxyacid-oxoacid transhydrogenase mitochondrial [Bienertia sinuspersici]
MAFGKKRGQQRDRIQSPQQNQPQDQPSTEEYIDEEEGIDQGEDTAAANVANQGLPIDKNKKPLLHEVTTMDSNKGKNAGGTKKWTCNHCKRMMLSDRQLLQSIRQKVEKAEQEGISPSLTKSTLNYKVPGTSSTPIANAFATVERHQCDVAIVRFLCANGVPFNVLRSPEFGSMVDTLKHAPKDYKPLSADKARTSVLDEVKRDVEKELAPIKDTWGTQGMSIVSDGWTNVKHQPLINVVASNSRGSMFLYAEDFSGVEKTGKANADFLLTSIDEVGPSNVLQVVTDNAANCKAAGKEIEKAHAIFKKQSGLELLKVAKTRFASHYLLLKRLSQCREALATTIVLTAWKDWVNSGDERMKALGREVANTISDELFWDEVENILTVTKPIYLMIKFADAEGPKMGEVYEKMDCMIGEVGDIMKNNKHKDDRDKMNEIMVSRWEKMNIPMHCLAFALNPYYYDANYLQIPAPGGEARRAPNYDKEVVQGVLDAFDKIGEDEEERKVLRHQLARFQAKEGIFGKLQAKNDAVSLSPIKWWNTYGAETPELAEIAVKVLSQPITSYKQGPHRKWDIEPESSYLDDSVARLEDMRWEGVETNAAIPRVPKRQRYAD